MTQGDTLTFLDCVAGAIVVRGAGRGQAAAKAYVESVIVCFKTSRLIEWRCDRCF